MQFLLQCNVKQKGKNHTLYTLTKQTFTHDLIVDTHHHTRSFNFFNEIVWYYHTLEDTMYFILLFSLSCINDGYDFKYWMYSPVDLTK